MFRTVVFLAAIAAAVLGLRCPALAADARNPTFTLALTPVPSPVLSARQTDMKIRGTYLTMDVTDPGAQYSVTGYGADYAARSMISDVFSFSREIGVIHLGGDSSAGNISPGDVSGNVLIMTYNLEAQIILVKRFSMILFAGPQLSYSMMEMKHSRYREYSDSFVYGAQGGVLMGTTMIDDTVGIDMIGMIMYSAGNQKNYFTFASNKTSGTYDVPSYTTTSLCLELEYIPWDLTLSSTVQQAGKNNWNEMKTVMYQLSWSLQF